MRKIPEKNPFGEGSGECSRYQSHTYIEGVLSGFSVSATLPSRARRETAEKLPKIDKYIRGTAHAESDEFPTDYQPYCL